MEFWFRFSVFFRASGQFTISWVWKSLFAKFWAFDPSLLLFIGALRFLVAKSLLFYRGFNTLGPSSIDILRQTPYFCTTFSFFGPCSQVVFFASTGTSSSSILRDPPPFFARNKGYCLASIFDRRWHHSWNYSRFCRYHLYQCPCSDWRQERLAGAIFREDAF